jgi:hypothetical protein
MAWKDGLGVRCEQLEVDFQQTAFDIAGKRLGFRADALVTAKLGMDFRHKGLRLVDSAAHPALHVVVGQRFRHGVVERWSSGW